MNFENKRLK